MSIITEEPPLEVIEEFKKRLESLDRGEGITTEELTERLRKKRETWQKSPTEYLINPPIV